MDIPAPVILSEVMLPFANRAKRRIRPNQYPQRMLAIV